MPIAGGAKVKLTDVSVAGGTWGEDGRILHAKTGGIWEVSENGGAAARDCVEVRRTGIPAAALARR